MMARAVKQSPYLDRVEKNMRKTGLAGTFLGTDGRRLEEILRDDQDRVCALGMTHEMIAQRLEELTSAAARGWGDPVVVEERFEVTAQEARGKIPCPWAHPQGLFTKDHVRLFDRRTGTTVSWTSLSLHLIRMHGFYQGIGSPYRLEPAVLQSVLFA